MIFALADCLTYLTEHGRYAPAALAAQGWRPVTPESFAAAEAAPPATVFVSHPRRSLVSWLLMYGQNSPASHVAAYLGGGHVCDATTSGVMIRPLSQVLTERSWFVDNREQPIPDDDRLRVVQLLVSMVGTPYDWQAIRAIALETITGSKEQPHPRLWTDTALLIGAACSLITAAARRNPALSAAASVGVYVALVARNRIRQHWSGDVGRRAATGRHPGIMSGVR